MGLLQKAVETYDAMAHRVGTVYEGENEPLAPISHIMVRAQIEITLDQNGAFISAKAVDKKAPKIIIPVTEESAGRTSAPCAHPLCDQLGYLTSLYPQKYRLYTDGLADWANSAYAHPKLYPVLSYVQSGTILEDLTKAALIQRNADGTPSDEKLMVCWVINGLGEGISGPCWTDKTLMDAFVQHYAAKQSDTPPVLCMVAGTVATPANQHPKGIVPINGNAKLISANDSSGFTYRGRFDDAFQAATVGHVASQKAHSALRWLIANQGITFGGRTFLCWNPEGNPVPSVTSPMLRGKDTQRPADPTQYREQLRKALNGWKDLIPPTQGVMLAAFDAATTGRLAVTYYNELQSSDFLQRLHDWDKTCCWVNGPYGIQAPSLYQLANCAFGAPRNGNLETDDRILSQQMQRLVACRVDKATFPLDIARALTEKASRLLLYEGESRQKLLFTACAAVYKYHCDHNEHFKEEWNMALDKNNTNRSYLFGRLLALAEALESSTYTDKGRRETNAIRMQQAFVRRPMATWRVLAEKLRPYSKRLMQSKPGLLWHYQNTIDEIMDKLSPDDTLLNQQLDDVYLLGYSHQRAYRSEKSDTQTQETVEE